MDNATNLARMARCDGIRISIPSLGYDEFQRRANALVDALIAASGAPEEAVRSVLKAQRIKSGRREGGELDTFFVSGKLARYFRYSEHLHHYWQWATEVHVKFHLVERFAGAHNAFVDALYAGVGKYATAYYGPTSSKRGKRNGGSKSARLGNGKSDLHVNVAQYRNERTGIEGHVKGRRLAGVKREAARQFNNVADAGLRAAAVAGHAFNSAAFLTADRFLTGVRSRGINLADYFTDACRWAYGELAPEHGDIVPIDADEEAACIMFLDRKRANLQADKNEDDE